MMEMIEVEVSRLSGAALEWAVAVALGLNPEVRGATPVCDSAVLVGKWPMPMWSSDFGNCGKLIDSEKIALRYVDSFGHELHGMWLAQNCNFRPTSKSHDWLPFGKSYASLETGYMVGATFPVAVCRFVAASKLGLRASVPAVLVMPTVGVKP